MMMMMMMMMTDKEGTTSIASTSGQDFSLEHTQFGILPCHSLAPVCKSLTVPCLLFAHLCL